MKRQVYLDYSATTPVKDAVLQEMLPYFTQNFGNPSSLYTIGQDARQAVETARERVAALVGASPKEIFFTSSGTEADNWAVISAAESRRSKGGHIITTQIEHHALLHSVDYLEKKGFEITRLAPDADGIVDPARLEAAIKDETILISVMFANNEVGSVQPIARMAQIAKAKDILFHTDAVQALGNVPIDVRALGVDLMSMSAHKIYGPKGVGALFVRKGVALPSLIHGGGQENKKRAGTENLTGIVGFGKAAELARDGLEAHAREVAALRDYFVREARVRIPHVRVNGSETHRLPGNANLTFEYIEGEALLLLLDLDGISVSTGSACSSASLTPSHVLTALGVPVELIHGSLRFTVGDFTTREDLDYTLECLVRSVEKLRRISSVSQEKGW